MKQLASVEELYDAYESGDKVVHLIDFEGETKKVEGLEDWVRTTKCLLTGGIFIKEPKIPVDLSVLSGLGIDCLFSDSLSFSNCGIGKLVAVMKDTETDTYLRRYKIKTFGDPRYSTYCKPIWNYWISTNNFDNPSSSIKKLTDAGFNLVKQVASGKVVAISIVGLQEGYYYPWDKTNIL